MISLARLAVAGSLGAGVLALGLAGRRVPDRAFQGWLAVAGVVAVVLATEELAERRGDQLIAEMSQLDSLGEDDGAGQGARLIPLHAARD
jgi:hypothetical protein